MNRPTSPGLPADEAEKFRRLQEKLPPMWHSISRFPDFEHMSVVVPSLSVDQDELSKIEGAAYYEERLLFCLMRLRHPGARVIYVTSQPVHPDIVEYYLHLLQGVPAHLARQRLTMLCVCDSSGRPLTDKILERPLLQERIRRLTGRTDRAYLTCFNSTDRERRLALSLGIPLNGVDPALLDLGSKSGSRNVFAAAGVPHPVGFEDLTGRHQIVLALDRLAQDVPGLSRAVVKLNHSFAGEGNALFDYPDPLPEDPETRYRVLDAGLDSVDLTVPGEGLFVFLEKFQEMGGIVEQYVRADELRSPSVQMRILPDRRLEVVSTHDQLLGGQSGQVYLGCRFPADDAYRAQIIDAARRIGDELRDRGVMGRFGIDFVVTRSGHGAWKHYAIEINLRMGGTTPPFMALQFLTGGHSDDTGRFLSRRGLPKFYRATDHLKSSHYRGVMPEDLIEHSVRAGLRYDPSTETGVLFHMIGALSQHGKLGVTCIADNPEETEVLFERTVAFLDEMTGASSKGHRHAPLLDLTGRPWTGME